MNRAAKWLFIAIVGFFVPACGGGEDSAKRDEEIKKVLQEGAQRERQMYEGMQKATENIEKSVEEQKESK